MEFEFVPFVGTVALDMYSTSLMQDNCIWMQYNTHVLQYNTRLTQNLAQCEAGLKDAIVNADSILSVP